MTAPKIVGNGHERPIEYRGDPDRDNETHGGFMFKDEWYWESDFAAVHNHFWNPNPPTWMKPYDGYLSDSFFSGVLVKYAEDDADYIKVYWFYS